MWNQLKQEMLVSVVFLVVLLVFYFLQDVGVSSLLLLIAFGIAFLSMGILLRIESRKQKETKV